MNILNISTLKTKLFKVQDPSKMVSHNKSRDVFDFNSPSNSGEQVTTPGVYDTEKNVLLMIINMLCRVFVFQEATCQGG